MEKKNERNEELIRKLRAESRENMAKLYGDRRFTPEKRKELIRRLTELCTKLSDTQRCVEDVRKLLPEEFDIDKFDSMWAKMGDKARFRTMYIKLDTAQHDAADYLKRIEKEKKEDDSSGG